MSNDKLDLILQKLDSMDNEIKEIKAEQDRKTELVINTIKEYGKQNDDGLRWVVDSLTKKTQERFERQESVNQALNKRLFDTESLIEQIRQSYADLVKQVEKKLRIGERTE